MSTEKDVIDELCIQNEMNRLYQRRRNHIIGKFTKEILQRSTSPTKLIKIQKSPISSSKSNQASLELETNLAEEQTVLFTTTNATYDHSSSHTYHRQRGSNTSSNPVYIKESRQNYHKFSHTYLIHTVMRASPLSKEVN